MQTLEASEMTVQQTMLRADRISRIGNKWLGRLKLDQTTIEHLSQSQLGLLAEGFIGLDTMYGRLLPMAYQQKETQTVVLYSSKEAGEAIYKQLASDGHCEACRKPQEQWKVGNLLFSSIEGLKRLDHEANTIDGVILLDPTCMVHRARTLKTYHGGTHDRPQIIVNFLADNVIDGVRPIFLIMTTKRAAAVPTDLVARAFCLEALWFLDGPSMTCS
jgi:hypothetical protein